MYKRQSPAHKWLSNSTLMELTPRPWKHLAQQYLPGKNHPCQLAGSHGEAGHVSHPKTERHRTYLLPHRSQVDCPRTTSRNHTLVPNHRPQQHAKLKETIGGTQVASINTVFAFMDGLCHNKKVAGVVYWGKTNKHNKAFKVHHQAPCTQNIDLFEKACTWRGRCTV